MCPRLARFRTTARLCETGELSWSDAALPKLWSASVKESPSTRENAGDVAASFFREKKRRSEPIDSCITSRNYAVRCSSNDRLQSRLELLRQSQDDLFVNLASELVRHTCTSTCGRIGARLYQTRRCFTSSLRIQQRTAETLSHPAEYVSTRRAIEPGDYPATPCHIRQRVQRTCTLRLVGNSLHVNKPSAPLSAIS